jgi:hypothetical protein
MGRPANPASDMRQPALHEWTSGFMMGSTIRKIPLVTSLSFVKIDWPVLNRKGFRIFKGSQNCLGFSLPLAVLANFNFTFNF